MANGVTKMKPRGGVAKVLETGIGVASYATIVKENVELQLVRKKLHRYCPPKILGSLTPDSLSVIEPYIYPMTVSKLRKYIKEDPNIWYYLVLPEADVLRLDALRDKAVDVLTDVLTSGRSIDKEEAVGAKLMVDAAKYILERTEMRFTSKSEITEKDLRAILPKQVRKMTIEELDEAIEREEI